MRIKKFLTPAIIVLYIGFIACGSKKESAASIAQKWCDLYAKSLNGAKTTIAALQDYGKELALKYKDNQAFMGEIEKEVIEKCKDASEGR